MLDVTICANFSVEKLMGLGNTRGQIFEFPIEMAGHPYNSAIAQPVMIKHLRICVGIFALNTSVLAVIRTK